jgi:hypothetical protein
MSIAVQTNSPRLRTATFDEHASVVRLEKSGALESLPLEDWRNLWLTNPLWQRLGKDWPIGWVLEDGSDRIVGSLANIPTQYTFQGRDLVCANGRGWVVAPEYRGFALWLMEEYFSQPGVDLFINTTIAPTAAPTFSTLSDRIPVGDFQSIAYWITGYRGFAKKALQKLRVPGAGLLAWPAAAALRMNDALLAESLPAAPASVAGSTVVETAEQFDDRFDAFWQELVRQDPDKLLAMRDRQSLAWHFAIPLRLGRLWIFTASRAGLLRAYCILKRQDRNDGVRRMQLVDYQSLDPCDELLPSLLRAALARCKAENMYAMEHVGCEVPKMRVFDSFAPYRRKLPCWPFYYRAADPAIKAELSRPTVWDPSTFDGDASFE